VTTSNNFPASTVSGKSGFEAIERRSPGLTSETYSPIHIEFSASRPRRPPFILDRLFLMTFISSMAAPHRIRTSLVARRSPSDIRGDNGDSTRDDPPPEIRNTIKERAPHDRTRLTIFSLAFKLLSSGNGCPATITSVL